MKNAPRHFLAKLIASMPIGVMKQSKEPSTGAPRVKRKVLAEAREETLNRIFMVRYRTQQL
jgi:hypothetical protein